MMTPKRTKEFQFGLQNSTLHGRKNSVRNIAQQTPRSRDRIASPNPLLSSRKLNMSASKRLIAASGLHQS